MEPKKFFAVQRSGHFQTTSVHRSLDEAVAVAAKQRKRAPHGTWFVFSCEPVGEFIDQLLACENVEIVDTRTTREKSAEAVFDLYAGKK